MPGNSKKKILFIVKSMTTPSSRIRVMDLLPGLQEVGFICDVEYLPKSFSAKLALFRKCSCYDAVVFQKRLLSYFEYRSLRANAAKLVFDFDDAVHLRNAAPSSDPGDYESSTRYRRFKRMIAGADLVVAANSVLAGAADAAAPATNVAVIPSSVPVSSEFAKTDYALSDPPVVGWVGTSVTARYLDMIAPELAELRRRRPFVLRVVSNFEFAADGLEVDNVEWTLDGEYREIRGFDIGIMPLSDDPFSQGKSSYKLLQYMSCGVPSVASAVGMNVEAAGEGESAMLADSPRAFVDGLESLLDDGCLRERLGRTGLERVSAEFERGVVAAKLADTFNSLFNL